MFDGQFAPYQPMQFEAWHPPGYGLGASIVHTHSVALTTNLTTYTFSAASLGTAATGRRILVAAGSNTGNSPHTAISSVTVGGNATTAVSGLNLVSSAMAAGFFILTLDTGTTGDVVVTMGEASRTAGIDVWAIYDLESSTPTDTASSQVNDPSGDLDISAGGVAVGYVVYEPPTTAASTSWTNLTENDDLDWGESNRSQSGASANFSTAQTALTITAAITDAAPVNIQLLLASFR